MKKILVFMKHYCIVLSLILGFLLMAANLYAAGDLVVEGNVGIGTTNPGGGGAVVKLDVRGNITATQDTDYVSAIYLNRSGGPTSGWNSPGGTWGVYRYGSGEGDRFSIGIAGVNEPFRIHTDGNVIMGVTSSGASSGNVGIGTTNPSAKLEVAGNAGTDGIKLPDGTLITTAQDYLFLNVVMTAYTTNTPSLSWVIDVGDSILDWDSIISAGYKQARIVTQMWMSATGNTGYLQMYDKTNTAVVTEFGVLTVTDTSSTTIKTSNWVNITNRTGLVNIGFQKVVTGGTCNYRNLSLQFRR